MGDLGGYIQHPSKPRRILVWAVCGGMFLLSGTEGGAIPLEPLFLTPRFPTVFKRTHPTTPQNPRRYWAGGGTSRNRKPPHDQHIPSRCQKPRKSQGVSRENPAPSTGQSSERFGAFRPGLECGFWRKFETRPPRPEKPQKCPAEKRGVCRDSQGNTHPQSPRAAQERRWLAACAGGAGKTTGLDRRRGGGKTARAGCCYPLPPPGGLARAPGDVRLAPPRPGCAARPARAACHSSASRVFAGLEAFLNGL